MMCTGGKGGKGGKGGGTDIKSMAKFKLGDHTFTTKTSALAFMKGILSESANQGLYQELSPYFQRILHDLVSYHSQDKQDLLHRDFKCFVVATQQNTRCFAVKTAADVPEHVCFSYQKCLNSTLRSQRHWVIAAARAIIMPQIKSFRASRTTNGVCTCEISGNVVPGDAVHVDHHFEKTPFHKLLQDFMAFKNLSFDEMETKEKQHGGDCVAHDGREFVNPVLNDAWTAYHAQYAVLRMVCSEFNMSGTLPRVHNGGHTQP
jgi:hypothetical protein